VPKGKANNNTCGNEELTQVRRPYQGPCKTNVVRSFDFALEGFGIVKRDPLIIIPGHVLDRRLLIVHRNQVSFLVFGDDILNFVVGEVCGEMSGQNQRT
jgi:hypothetical protein